MNRLLRAGLLAGALALLAPRALSLNPIIPNVGQADPHIHWWPEANEYVLYSTHDYSPNNTGFYMRDWWTFSSPDLVVWSAPQFLYPNATPAPTSAYGSCWATDGAHKEIGGKMTYFFYLSIGKCETAVMQGDGPMGPWRNVLGQPLLNSTFGNSLKPACCFRDPAVFQDDDGSYYLISGVFEYRIMRLGDDLVSIAEEPRLVNVSNALGPYGAETDDKPFIHKANGLYYCKSSLNQPPR